MVFGPASEHGRSTDIDLLDRLFQRNTVLGNRIFERVEVHDHQIDHFDVVIGRSCTVLIIAKQRRPPREFSD